jgi:hypothetical protein
METVPEPFISPDPFISLDSMKIRPRLSIRVLLIVIALIAMTFGFVRYWYDPVVYYRRNHDFHSFHLVMITRVSPGDTLTKIEELLGPSKLDTSASLRKILEENAAEAPSIYPQGLRAEDEIRGFPVETNGQCIL